MSINKVEIKYDTLEFIMHQIERNIYELKRRYNSDDLKILMPNWIKGIFYRYHRQKVSIIDFNHLYGVEILPHYKNEIVVFNENYSVDKVSQHLVITVEPSRPFPGILHLPKYKQMKIQDTKAFQQMDCIQQRITLMAQSRKKINDSVLLLKNVGLERWEKLSTGLPNRWKNIVKELAAV